MANITELIKDIRNALFGREVRESIARAIEQCYEDVTKAGNANAEISEARGRFDTLNKRLNSSDISKADRTEVENTKINLQAQINSLASGSPLVANSINEMTDINRVYVNSTNGHWYWHNGTAWVDGGIYQASEIGNGSISPEKTSFLQQKENLFNQNTVVEGMFWHTGSNSPVENVDFAYNILPVEPMETYTVSGTSYNLSFLAKDGRRIAGDTNSNGKDDYTFTVPEGSSIAYVVLSYRFKTYPTETYMMVKGDSLPTEYIPYGFNFTKDILLPIDNTLIHHTYISVKKDGTGDHSSIYEAVKRANSIACKENPVDIRIFDTSTNYKGTSFDILEEMGGNDYLSTITDTSNIQKGMPLNNYVNLVGIGQVKLYAHLPDDCTLAQSTCFSTIEIFGNSTLDNLTVEIKNGRYPVHDESNNNNPKTTHSFNKCKFIHLGNASGLWKNCHAYASGTSGGCTYNYKDCIFDASASGGYPYDLHNYAPQLGSDISLDGCIMKKSPSQPVSIKFGFNGYSPVITDPVAFVSCHINVFLKNIIADGIIRVAPENYSYNCTNNFVLHNFTVLEVDVKDDVII